MRTLVKSENAEQGFYFSEARKTYSMNKTVEKTASQGPTTRMIAPALNRRDILKAGLAGFLGTLPLGFLAPDAIAAGLAPPVNNVSYSISLHNGHTGESFNGVYRVGSRYIPEAFDRLNVVLRDFRTNDVFPIDPRAIDILYMVHRNSGARSGYEVLSGYRSPKTNDMLRRASSGVARNSLHLTGQAIDMRLPGYSTRSLHNVAMDLHAGGVGYYPASNFVHVDTGRVRHWQGPYA